MRRNKSKLKYTDREQKRVKASVKEKIESKRRENYIILEIEIKNHGTKHNCQGNKVNVKKQNQI
jgi:hypothetical protein